MRTVLLSAGFMLWMATGAIAQQVKQIDIIDFLLDWEQYEGQTVAIMGGGIAYAQAERVMVHSSAGYFLATPPWRDKDDLRFLLRACAGPHIAPECRIPVVGAVSRSSDGKKPELIDVDFALPVFN